MRARTTLVKHHSLSFEIDQFLNVFNLSYQNKIYFASLSFSDAISENLKRFFETHPAPLVAFGVIGKLAFSFSLRQKPTKTVLVAFAKVKTLAFSFTFTITRDQIIIEAKVISNKRVFYGLSFRARSRTRFQITEPRSTTANVSYIISYSKCQVSLASTFPMLQAEGNTITLRPTEDLPQGDVLEQWSIRPGRLGRNYNVITIGFAG